MKTAPASAKQQKPIRFAIPTKFGIDPQTGILTGLCLLQAGREALGHGIFIDQKTLETGQACVAEDGGRLKGYVTHGHSGPCSWRGADMDEAASELNIPGFFSNLEIKTNQLIAEKFEFYDAFKKNFAPQYEQLIEMAQKTPELLGLSIEAWGYAVYVDKDGKEYGSEPENTELLYNGMPALRITELFAAAFVSDPAATDGLFATFSRALFGGKQNESRRLYKALAKSFRKLAKKEDAEEQSQNALHSGAPNKDASQISPTMKIIADLKTKYGADEKKFAQAMLIVGKNSTLTLEGVEAEMVHADLAASNSQIALLTTELATAKQTIATLTSERDTAKTETAAEKTKLSDLQKRFDALKTSGVDPVPTGVVDGGAASGEENPFITGNLSAQAALLKQDPQRAKVLEDAAKAAKAAKPAKAV